MPDRDIMLAKVASIQKCLARIRETTSLDPASIDDINSQETPANHNKKRSGI